jgi:thioesterase domain-containing protein
MSREIVAAAVRFSEGASASPESLQSWCRNHVRREAVPERWYVVDTIPRTARGKVNRDTVRSKLVGAIAETGRHDVVAPFAADTEPRTDAVAESVRKIVARAWTAILGNARTDLSWYASGGDSLSTLRLWFDLEKDLGVRLPLDIMDPSATLDELSTAVVKGLTSQASQQRHAASDHSPVVFLLPATPGDTPILARFRAAIAGKIRFVVINYPTWRELIRKGGELDAIVEAAFAQIRAQSHSDTYFLAGYSSGGIVAYEVARRLVQSGGRIGFLGLIDVQIKRRVLHSQGQSSRPPEAILTRTVRRLKLVTKQPLQAFRDYFRLRAASLASRSAHRRLTVIGQLTMALPRKIAFEWHWHLGDQVSLTALRKWTQEPQDVRAILFRGSEEQSDVADYGWSALCRQLTVIEVPGDHASMLDPPNLDVLCGEFLKTVETASNS